jgi:hypothetical protein
LNKDISRQEEKKKLKVKLENEAKITRLQEEYSRKLKRDRGKRERELNDNLKRFEAAQKRKADLEIEAYRQEQEEKFNKNSEVTEILGNKRRNSLKNEYQKRVEQERKRIEGMSILD